jgi:glutamate-1-semialdehyde 2,1-aminomutase
VAVALRLARAATGRRCILKFEGHYHGWLDGAFASTAYWPDRSGPAGAPAVVPGTDGVSAGALQDVLVAPWNDLDATRRIVEDHAADLAAIILEPLLVNGGLIAPEPGFLDGLQELTRRAGSLLIFDEVITGLRLGLGGAQGRFGVTADLAIFAKALAGGVPIAAVTGRAAVLDLVASGRVVHNGTFNGNGLGTAAALATIQRLSSGPAVYPTLFDLGDRLATGLASASGRLRVRHLGPIVHTSVDEPADVRSIRDRASGDPAAHARFIEALLGRGVHATPRGLWYLSLAHSTADVDVAIEAAREAAAEVLG